MIILIYGVAFILIIYFTACLFYPVSLFPDHFPNGYFNNPSTNPSTNWSGKPYAPNKFGSPGASPSGGMRPSFSIPSSSPVGYWGNSPHIKGDVHLDIYDYSDLPVEYITDVGHW